MYLTARSRLILEQLLLTKTYHDVTELAERFEVSERTIRRDLKEVSELLEENGLTLKRDKQAISIQGSEEKSEAFKWQVLDLTYNDYTPDERQQYILKELLKATDSIKLVALANDLNVTVATVSNDLSKIENDFFLANKIIRKPGLGIYLDIDEKSKRQLLSDLFWKRISHSQFIQLYNQRNTNAFFEERLDFLFENIDIKIIERGLSYIKEVFGPGISDDAYFNLVIHLAVSVERILEGNALPVPENLSDLKQLPEYQITRDLLEQTLADVLPTIPEGEIAFLTTHIRGTKTYGVTEYYSENEHFYATTLAAQLIRLVSENVEQELYTETLLKGLTAHLRPTLRRLQDGLSINNPLLETIKEDYQDLFYVIRHIFNTHYPEMTIPDEEIGFLVLHFGAAILQNSQKASLSGLVICASGIGTSKMLVTRLKKAIPQLKYLKTISLFELERNLASHDYDVIVSTIDLGKVPYRYFLVSPILTDRELSKIEIHLQSKISTYTRRTTSVVNDVTLNKHEALHFIQKQEEKLKVVHSLMKRFEVHPINSPKGTQEDVLRAMCTNLLHYERNLDIEALVASMRLREEWSGFGVTGTQIALFHARTAEVDEPVFQLFPILNGTMLIPGMDGKEIAVNTLVLLLAPEKFETEGLDILSQLSSMLIENQETIDLIESGNTEEISSFVIAKLLSFLNES